LGLLVALSVSERVLGLDRAVRERTEALLAALGLETSVELPAVSLILAAAGRDKKVKSGTIGFVGLRSLGQPEWGLDVSSSTFAGALEVIRR
jgi:3-dehydroquinate synthase